ncbi:MAG: hypothetical protein QOE63_2121, partial [Acidimicrobiaceae bacterium]
MLRWQLDRLGEGRLLASWSIGQRLAYERMAR